MKPTRASVLVSLFLIAAVAVWLLIRATYSSLAALSPGPVLTVGLIAVVELFLTWSVRNRMRGRNGARPMHPIGVARMAALARASSPVGALATGAWAGAEAYVLSRDGGLSVVQHDRLVAGAGVVVGLALVAVALWLEWTCRVPPRPDGEQPG